MHNTNTVEAAVHLAQAIKQQLIRQIESQEFGVAPMHVRVIKIISKRPNCTAHDIARLVERDKAQVARLIKGLIDNGLVQKQLNPEDKRSQLLVLTAKGKVIQEHLLQFAETTHKTITQGIDKDELDTFLKVAQTMTKNLTSNN